MRIIGDPQDDEGNIDFSKSAHDEQVDPFDFSENTKEVPFEPEIIATPVDEEIHNISEIKHTEKEMDFFAKEVIENTVEQQPTDLFIFNVVAKEGSQLGGMKFYNFS
ncbi:hypothetical protein ACLKMH_16500 [Psychromonas sp. KJ10-10]|uniref:hypothetical protein n=1 Tax=Psychromonas sp. KJ10-10 TaxID=3391823 RepID=UPI0039B48225